MLVRTDEDGPFLVGLACLLSKGALFVGLGATPMPCDKVPKCAVREFYSSGSRDGIRGTVNRQDLSVGTLGRDLPAALRGRRACGLTARAGRLASAKNLVRRAVSLLVEVA